MVPKLDRLGYLVDFAARLATEKHAKRPWERSSGTQMVLVRPLDAVPGRVPPQPDRHPGRQRLETIGKLISPEQVRVMTGIMGEPTEWFDSNIISRKTEVSASFATRFLLAAIKA